jgi:hypothetical protein
MVSLQTFTLSDLDKRLIVRADCVQPCPLLLPLPMDSERVFWSPCRILVL